MDQTKPTPVNRVFFGYNEYMEPTLYPPTQLETAIFRQRNQIKDFSEMYGQGENDWRIDRTRSFVVTSHNIIEELLISITAKNRFVKVFPKYRIYGTSKYPEIRKIYEEFADELGFSRILSLALRTKSIPEEVRHDINEETLVRNAFSHGRNKDLQYFLTEESENKVLALLQRVIADLTIINNSFGISDS